MDAQTSKTKSRTLSCRPLRMALLAGAAGLAAMAIAFHLVRQQEGLVRQLAFDRACDDRAAAIGEAIQAKTLVLKSVRTFFAVSGNVTRQAFGDFVRPYLADVPGIQALEWIPRVAGDDRARFEASARGAGVDGFEIRARRDGGVLAGSPARGEYFPVLYAEPMGPNRAAIGFDLGSDSDRKKAIDHSRAAGEPVATGGITLVQETQGQTGFLLLAPVYGPAEPGEDDDRLGPLRGFALGAFRVSDMVEAAAGRLHGPAVEMAVWDMDGPEARKLLYRRRASGEGGWDGRSIPPAVGGIEPRRAALEIGGRRWLIVCAPTAAFAAGGGWVGWTVMLTGTAMSLLLGAYVFRTCSESERLAEKVKRATAQVRLSEERLTLALEGSGAGLWDWQVQTGEARFSATWAAQSGHDLPDLEGASIETWKRLCHPDDLERSEELVRRHLAGDTARYECESRLRHRDGHWVWVLNRGRVIEWDNQGRPARMTGTQIDVTDRKTAEQRLLREKALLRCLIDSIPDLIFFKDVHGVYLGCNSAFARYAGRTEEQLVGFSDLDMFSPGVAGAYVANDKAMLAGGAARRNEEWIDYPDGSRSLLETLKTPYYGPDGRVLGLIGVSRDITRAKQAELTIVDAHRRLLNAREEERRRIAETLHESICQDVAALQMFLAPLGHDVRAVPLEADRSRLQAATQACKEILGKTRDICYDLYPPVLAGLGLAAGLQSLSRASGFAGVRIAVSWDDASGSDEGLSGLSKIALYRAAQEAISNAVRHGHASAIRIALARLGDGIRLEVTDDGAGFDAANPREGLGLTIMRERMLAVGGTVEFSSRPGHTSITAFAPLAPPPPAESASPDLMAK